MSRILIAGCGYVGTVLGLKLCAAGHQVWGLRRDTSQIEPPIHPLPGDLRDRSSLRDLPDLEIVIYAASPDRGDPESYRQAYLDGPENLLSALRNSHLRRLLFVSSTSVYGQSGGEWVDENSPTEPAHFSGRTLLEAEAFLLEQSGLPATVVRFGGIYGPQRTGLIESVRRRTAVCPEGVLHFSNRIHVDDCAGILQHLMELPRPENIYLGVDCEPAEYCAVLRWLARQLGLEPPPVVPSAEAGTRTFRSNKRCHNRRLLESGYRFRFPTYREGYESILRGWRSSPSQ